MRTRGAERVSVSQRNFPGGAPARVVPVRGASRLRLHTFVGACLRLGQSELKRTATPRAVERGPAGDVLHALPTNIQGVQCPQGYDAPTSFCIFVLITLRNNAAGKSSLPSRYLFAVACVELLKLQDAELALKRPGDEEVRACQYGHGGLAA